MGSGYGYSLESVEGESSVTCDACDWCVWCAEDSSNVMDERVICVAWEGVGSGDTLVSGD